MASIGKEAGGYRILFVAPDGKRKTVRLGKVSRRQAEAVKTKIEGLNAAALTGHSPDDEVSRWEASLDTIMADKLASVGLIPKRELATLGPFIDGYIARRVDVKPATKEIWRQGKMGLVGFFGADRPMRDITPGDADNYKLHLIGVGLASMTVRKRLQFAKTIFRAAVRHKLILSDPFAEVGIQATMPDRMHFVSRQDTAKILEACPSRDWRLIVALSRYGGLRCPSEVLSLKWQGVDWAAGRITVYSPKTEHCPGKDTRAIPLFPELRPYLEEAFDAAPEGAVYIVDERFRRSSMGKAGWRNCNLRTTFQKIIRRAGLDPWPRLFHNLRSSRETELTERFPLHVVTGWLGHTQEIALKHYCQVTDEHFAQAMEPALNPAQQAAQNPAQQPAERVRSIPQSPCRLGEGSQSDDSRKVNPREGLRGLAAPSGTVVSPWNQRRTDGEGFEPPVDSRPQQFSRLPP